MIFEFPFGVSGGCRYVVQDLELAGHVDVHLVSHLQMITYNGVCHVHARVTIFVSLKVT